MTAATTARAGRSDVIQVNGVTITRAAITREAQYHAAPSAAESRRLAAQALVVREVVLQRARELGLAPEPRLDERGRRETDEEAQVRTLVEQEVHVPSATEAELQRYYDANRARFRAAELFEARHILISAGTNDADRRAAARAKADELAVLLAADPSQFAALAAAHSACSSASSGGYLGQVTASEVTPGFAVALAALCEGETSAPVETPYGFHLIRLERRLPAKELPFAAVAARIAAYLGERAMRTATAQYVARLVSQAAVSGFEIAGAAEHRVH